MTQVAEGQIGKEAPPATPPDWESITEEIACPLCEYNLRGLTEPRCPECGYRFGWQEMLDPTQRLHPYLFEHHPERNVWSFVKTFIEHLRPIRFWRQLHPNQPSHPNRIFKYWLCILAVYLLTITVVIGAIVPGARAFSIQFRAALPRDPVLRHAKLSLQYGARFRKYATTREFLDSEFPVSSIRIAMRGLFGRGNPTGPVFLLIMLWPWLTMATFYLFRKSLGRVGIRLDHLMRVVVYSCDAVVWPCAGGAVAILGLYLSQPVVTPNLRDTVAIGWLVVFGTAALLWIFRLVVGFKYYLRYERPVTIALISQFMLGLAVFGVVTAAISL